MEYASGQTGILPACNLSCTPMHHVLVVEDDPSCRTLLFALLNNRAITCDGASDGAEAITKLRQRSYCAILLDLMLPVVNGFEVLQFLRCERPRDVGRVIVMTSANNGMLRYVDPAGTCNVLHKPFDIHEVRAVTQRCAEQCDREHAVSEQTGLSGRPAE